MILRYLTVVVPLTALALTSGCKSTSNRTSYCTQPAVVTAVPAPPPCAAPVVAVPAAPCPTAGVVPPPPPGFVR